MRMHRRAPKTVELPVAALHDPVALVTALSHARLVAGLPAAHWTHDQLDRHMVAADRLLRELDPATVADDIAAA